MPGRYITILFHDVRSLTWTFRSPKSLHNCAEQWSGRLCSWTTCLVALNLTHEQFSPPAIQFHWWIIPFSVPRWVTATSGIIPQLYFRDLMLHWISHFLYKIPSIWVEAAAAGEEHSIARCHGYSAHIVHEVRSSLILLAPWKWQHCVLYAPPRKDTEWFLCPDKGWHPTSPAQRLSSAQKSRWAKSAKSQVLA
jgi:hypothetical protein